MLEESNLQKDKIARMIKNGSLDMKKQENTHKTFSFPVSQLALMQHIQNQFGFRDYNETLFYCVWLAAVENGIESL